MDGQRAQLGITRSLSTLRLPFFSALAEAGFEPAEGPAIEPPPWITRSDPTIEITLDAEDRPIPMTWSTWIDPIRTAARAMRRRTLHAPGYRERHGDRLRLNLVLTADLEDLTYRFPPRDWSGLDALDPRSQRAPGSVVLTWAGGSWTALQAKPDDDT